MARAKKTDTTDVNGNDNILKLEKDEYTAENIFWVPIEIVEFYSLVGDRANLRLLAQDIENRRRRMVRT